MLQMDSFLRTDIVPSWIANALTKALSQLAANFKLQITLLPTAVTIPAGADQAAAIVAIEGLWRWNEAPLTIAHPGGAAGVYPMFVTASANDIQPVPDPNTDDTDYSFDATILAPGHTPTIVAGTVDVFLHVADVHWDGGEITRIDQLVPAPTLHAGQHASAGADPLTPADIGAVPAGDPSTLRVGDIVTNAWTSRAGGILCDGRAVSRTTYLRLFGLIGTAYGAGDGTTTFNVPDLPGGGGSGWPFIIY